MSYVRRRWRSLLREGAFTFAENALFPRLSWRLRWSAHVGLGGALLYTLYRIGLVVAFFAFVRWLKRNQEEAWADVREALGREPTAEEVHEHLMRRHEARWGAEP